MDDNKTELFSFLSHQVVLLQTEGKAVYATDGHDVLCSMAQIIIVPGSSTNVVYRADDRNDEHDDMMH